MNVVYEERASEVTGVRHLLHLRVLDVDIIDCNEIVLRLGADPDGRVLSLG